MKSEPHKATFRPSPIQSVNCQFWIQSNGPSALAKPLRVAVSIGEALDPADYLDADIWVGAVWGTVKEHHARCKQRLTG